MTVQFVMSASLHSLDPRALGPSKKAVWDGESLKELSKLQIQCSRVHLGEFALTPEEVLALEGCEVFYRSQKTPLLFRKSPHEAWRSGTVPLGNLVIVDARRGFILHALKKLRFFDFTLSPEELSSDLPSSKEGLEALPWSFYVSFSGALPEERAVDVKTNDGEDLLCLVDERVDVDRQVVCFGQALLDTEMESLEQAPASSRLLDVAHVGKLLLFEPRILDISELAADVEEGLFQKDDVKRLWRGAKEVADDISKESGIFDPKLLNALWMPLLGS